MKKALIIFAREAVPGKVKTRLAASVGPQAAAGIYDGMLRDVLEGCRRLADVTPVLFWSRTDTPFEVLAARYGHQAREQSDGDLGERMGNAFAETFTDGSDICCIIGSDSPDLPPAYIRHAFELLEGGEADAVFGPAEDGGYYLLGLRENRRELFEGIPWGTPQVLETSLERARSLGLRSAFLPPWYDIDTLDDLLRLTRSAPANARRTREAAGRLLKDNANLTPSEELAP
ncbi:MAG: TIGR04282 family arsenosugar biosynthesis glycosyltransferase [Deltaproteobacteria bacterium]|nr:TIGR04282 family arsenosugar biosynthesis glycosyltransferase [Deltaproteobacteria bacterium]